MSKSPLVDKIVELATVHGDQRDYKEMEYFNPKWFIEKAILDWVEDDIFFRAYDRSLLERLGHGPSAEVKLMIFRKPGMECYFGYPESRSAIMNQLGLGEQGRYSCEIQAAVMIVLARAGFECLGSFQANHIIDYQPGTGKPDTKVFNVPKAQVGKIIRQEEHIGFRLMPEQWGQDMYLLVQKSNLAKPGEYK